LICRADRLGGSASRSHKAQTKTQEAQASTFDKNGLSFVLFVLLCGIIMASPEMRLTLEEKP